MSTLEMTETAGCHGGEGQAGPVSSGSPAMLAVAVGSVH